MNTQEVIIGLNVLETLFKVISSALHKSLSPDDVYALIASVKNKCKTVPDAPVAPPTPPV